MTSEIITAQSYEGPWYAYQQGTLTGSESDTVGSGETEELAVLDLLGKKSAAEFKPIFIDRHYDIEGQDMLQVYLDNVWPIYRERQAQLRASRDSRAIAGSNANTLFLIKKLAS